MKETRYCHLVEQNGRLRCIHCGWRSRRLFPGKVVRICPRPRFGLGTLIAGITRRLGIRQCRGCRKRQRTLDERFPLDTLL